MKEIFFQPNKRYPKRKRVLTINPDPSMTDQSQKDACDVNRIVATHYKNRIPLPSNPGIYQDVSQISDLEGALNQVRMANAAFDALPSELRAKLGNDPKNLITYLQNPQNIDEAAKYGLVIKKQEKSATMPEESAPTKKAKKNDESNDDKK